MPYTVDFDTVSTVGLESSPVAGRQLSRARTAQDTGSHSSQQLPSPGLVSWQEAGPLATAAARCDPAVRRPDVALMWPPRGSPAANGTPWKVIGQGVSHHPAGRSAWLLPRRRRSVVPRRLVASSSGLLAQRCLVGIEPPLELAPFGVRPDLDEEHHHDTGPQ